MRRPVMTELIFGYLRLLEKNIEQGLALAFVHVLDRDRELWIDEQDLAAGHRVHAYDRMNRGRVQLLPTHHVLSILFGIVEQFAERLEVVNRFEARDELLHAVAKTIEGRRHTSEHRVAADRRHFLSNQNRGLRWLLAECLVGMPDVGAERWIGFIITKFDQRRGFLIPGRERMHGQFAEPPAKVHQVVRGDVLVAEDDELVLGQRVLDSVAHLIGDWLPKIDASDLSAEVGGDPRNREASMLGDDRTALEIVDGRIHGAFL